MIFIRGGSGDFLNQNPPTRLHLYGSLYRKDAILLKGINSVKLVEGYRVPMKKISF